MPGRQDEHSLQSVSPTLSDTPNTADGNSKPASPHIRSYLQSFAYLNSPSGKPRSEDKTSTAIATGARVRTDMKRQLSGRPAARQSTLKRERESNGIVLSASSTKVKKRRSTTKERSANDPHQVENNLVDSLRKDLVLVMIGLNPGLTTAATGHAYAHASNLFWKLLHWSGITPIKHLPSDTRSLMDLYSIGNTNICARATRTGDGLTKEELVEGAHILDEKIREFRPEAVCIVGKGVWEPIFKMKTGKPMSKGSFNYGWQDEKLWLGRTVAKDKSVEWPGARTFVATTTSGLAAGMSTQQKIDIWLPLGEWLQQRKGELMRPVKTESAIKTEDDAQIKAEDEPSG